VQFAYRLILKIGKRYDSEKMFPPHPAAAVSSLRETPINGISVGYLFYVFG